MFSLQVIDRTCFYFERRKLNYHEAQANCRTKFGQKHTGRLFEPRNFNVNNIIFDEAQSILKNQNPYWIGLTDLGRGGGFKYASNGQIPELLFRLNGGDVDEDNEHCIKLFGGKWHDELCHYVYSSICESPS